MSGAFLDLLARDLRRLYGLEADTQISLLKYSENLTYLVRRPAGEQAVLRVCRPGYHSPEELDGEVAWLRQLQAEGTVLTAAVLPSRAGRCVELLSGACSAASPFSALLAAEGEGNLRCVLFAFAQGQTLHDLRGDELYSAMERLGAIAASLHSQVIGWAGSRTLKRFSWDLEAMVGPRARWGSCAAMAGVPAQWQSCYARAVALARTRLERYGTSPLRYGLIHSDLNLYNVLVDRERMTLLDFDDCGFGWYLYDLSSTLSEYFGEELACCRAALLRGYQSCRRLAPEDLEELDTFIVLRKIMRIGWIASHSENDTVKSVPGDFCKNTMLLAQDLLARQTAGAASERGA